MSLCSRSTPSPHLPSPSPCQGSREGGGQCWLPGYCSTSKPCLLSAGRQAWAKFPSELSA